MRNRVCELGVTAVLGLVAVACNRSSASLPPVAELRKADPDFVTSRPDCSLAILDAAKAGNSETITRLAAEHEDFNCAADVMPALEYAIHSDAPERVEAVLLAGADPNGRWSSNGDRLPLQDTLESERFGYKLAHLMDIVRTLLEYGADPDARWCPFESRGSEPYACHSDRGITPLFAAAVIDDAASVQALLDAVADAAIEEGAGWTALDHAHSAPVVELLLPPVSASGTISPEKLRSLREQDALRQFMKRHPDPDYQLGSTPRTPLCEAILYGLFERVSLLLRAGADPNRRCDRRHPVSWTPLATALTGNTWGDASQGRILRDLLSQGADVNLRWCPTGASEACNATNGTTPLMAAADDSCGNARCATGGHANIDVVKLVLSSHANPRLRDWKNRIAADYARSSTRTYSSDLIRLLSV